MKLILENWRKYLKEDIGGIPQSGPSSGAPTDAEAERTEEIAVSDLLELPYNVAYHPDVEEIDTDPEHEDRDWEVYEKVREYANYFEANPNLSNLPPIQIKGDWVIDGAHRINALRLATKKVPELLDQTVWVEFLPGEYSGPGAGTNEAPT